MKNSMRWEVEMLISRMQKPSVMIALILPAECFVSCIAQVRECFKNS